MHFQKRVFQCVVGALIGYFVNYIIFFYKNREREILNLIDTCLTVIIEDRNIETFNKTMALLEKEYTFMIDDKGKTKRKSKMSKEKINFLKWNKELLQKLNAFVITYEVHKNNISNDCKFQYALMSHKQVLDTNKQGSFKVEKIAIPSFSVEKHEDLLLLGRLIEYVNMINQYA